MALPSPAGMPQRWGADCSGTWPLSASGFSGAWWCHLGFPPCPGQCGTVLAVPTAPMNQRAAGLPAEEGLTAQPGEAFKGLLGPAAGGWCVGCEGAARATGHGPPPSGPRGEGVVGQGPPCGRGPQTAEPKLPGTVAVLTAQGPRDRDTAPPSPVAPNIAM